MSEYKQRQWPNAITIPEMRDRLGKACCALDKLAQWTPDDDAEFGDFRTFATVAIELAMAPSTDGRFSASAERRATSERGRKA